MITIQNNANEIVLFGRDQTRTAYVKKIKDFKPYFYYETTGGVYDTIHGTRAQKIICNNPRDVSFQRQNYNKTYEADVVYANRYIIDRIDNLEKEPIRICYLDIETEMVEGFDMPHKSPKKILSIYCYDNFNEEYTKFCIGVTHSNEKEMLNSFLNYIQTTDPDMLTAWNGDNFDFPFIIGRLKKLGLDVRKMGRGGDCYVWEYANRFLAKVYGRILFDLMYAYKGIVSAGREKWSLDYISKYEGVGEKDVYKGSLEDLYNTDKKAFLEYNKKDVELLVKLNEKLNIVDFYDEVRRTCFCKFEDVFMNSKLADCLCLKYAKNKYVLPTSQSAERNRYKGGLVRDSDPKLHKNIAVMDMKSLYPTIMIGFNTSYETYIDKSENNCTHIDNKFHYKSTPGMIPAIVKPLLTQRKVINDEMEMITDKKSREYKTKWMSQYALKVIANSFYGVLGSPHFRLYKREVAESITYAARMIIMDVAKWFENKGYKIVYGDTDSVFVNMGTASISNMVNLNDEINNWFKTTYFKQFNVQDENNIFQLEFEKVFKTVFFKRKSDGKGAKKKYAGRIMWADGNDVDTHTVVGFESRRSDTPAIGRELIKNVLKMIVYEEDKSDMDAYIKEFRDNIKMGNYTAEELGLPIGITKDLSKYGNQIHARAARTANEKHNAGIKAGDKIKYLYVTNNCGVIGFKDYLWDGYQIDYDKMIGRIVDKKIGPLYEGLGWEYEYVARRNARKTKFEKLFQQKELWI